MSTVHRKKQHASSIRTIPSKNIAFIQVFFFESSNSMQYRSMLFNCIHVHLNLRSNRFKAISSTALIVRSFEESRPRVGACLVLIQVKSYIIMGITVNNNNCKGVYEQALRNISGVGIYKEINLGLCLGWKGQ